MMSNYKTILGIGISIIGLQILTSEASITNPTEERSAKQPEYLAPMESKMTDSIQLDKKIEKASTTNPTEGTSAEQSENCYQTLHKHGFALEIAHKHGCALALGIATIEARNKIPEFGDSNAWNKILEFGDSNAWNKIPEFGDSKTRNKKLSKTGLPFRVRRPQCRGIHPDVVRSRATLKENVKSS